MEPRKYPKTYHLPWSPGLQNDDRVAPSMLPFESLQEIVVTEKLDGENTTMYSDRFHARSMDSKNHDSRNFVKGVWGTVRWQIPNFLRICGENMYAKHSIFYNELPSYFFVFAIFKEYKDESGNLRDECLSWDETVDICEQLGLMHVPVLYRGPWDRKAIDACMTGVSKFGGEQEGYVIRNSKAFDFADFQTNVVKYVREKHVRTNKFWMSEWMPNKLKEG